jgi:hypothetical protein
MRGGLENMFDPDEFTADEQKKQKEKAKTIEDKIREAGV